MVTQANNPEINNAAGRFAAASMAFSGPKNTPPPRRTVDSTHADQETASGAGARGLVPTRVRLPKNVLLTEQWLYFNL